MELKVLEEGKNRMIVELRGETHTLANLLEKELWQDKDITVAGYHVEHPLIGIPRMIVETNGKESPRNALENAAKRLKKQNSDFVKAFKKGIK